MHDVVNALYKGRSKLKKGTGQYFDNPKKPKKACVLGAIYFGLYGHTTESMGLPLEISFDYPEIRKWSSGPAPCGHDAEGGMITSILIHLNDVHTGRDWPDQKIAGWLENELNAKDMPAMSRT